MRRLQDEGLSPADGLDYEIAFGSGDQLKVSLVWDSQERFEAFAARLMPILEEFGIDPGEPEGVRSAQHHQALDGARQAGETLPRVMLEVRDRW